MKKGLFSNSRFGKERQSLPRVPSSIFSLPYVIFTIVYMVGVPTLTTYISGVQEGAPAFEAGIREGDVIAAIDGKEITRWERLDEIISKSDGRRVANHNNKRRSIERCSLKAEVV